MKSFIVIVAAANTSFTHKSDIQEHVHTQTDTQKRHLNDLKVQQQTIIKKIVFEKGY